MKRILRHLRGEESEQARARARRLWGFDPGRPRGLSAGWWVFVVKGAG